MKEKKNWSNKAKNREKTLIRRKKERKKGRK